MKNSILNKVYNSAVNYRKEYGELKKSQQNLIEKYWDIEHAYYSSALEGSKIERKEFEKLGAKVK